jgi:hypothetical protein
MKSIRGIPGERVGHATVTHSAKAVIREGAPAAHWSTYIRGDAAKLKRRGMNKTESAYSLHLGDMKAAREIIWWEFQPWRLRCSDQPEGEGTKTTWYTPDFAVMLPDGEIQIHEVKGFTAQQDRLRIRMAIDRHPFQFFKVTRKGGGWKVERL